MSRFRPDGWSEFLTRTFDIADFHSGIYAEIIAPDLRPAALITVVLLVILYFSIKSIKIKTTTRSCPTSRPNPDPGRRLLFSFVIGWCIAWGSWLFVSGNGRYILPLIVLVGPLLGIFLWKLPIRKDFIWLLIIMIILMQSLLLNSSSPSKGWSILKNRWSAPHPFASGQSLLEEYAPDTIITTQSQTMMALMIEIPAAKTARLLSLDFVSSMGNDSRENKAAIQTINQSKNPILLYAFNMDFSSDSSFLKRLWLLRSQKILNQYGLSADESSCKSDSLSLNIMIVACRLVQKEIQMESVHTPSPLAEESMKKLINLCGASLQPMGARYILEDGSLVHIFREARYIVLASVDGSLLVKRNQELNYRMRWNGKNEIRDWNSVPCDEIIKN